MLKIAGIVPDNMAQRPSAKLRQKYMGPYEIEQRYSPVVYRLKLLETLRIHPVFHVSRLKLYHSSNEFKIRKKTPPPPQVKAGHQEYEVEWIVDKRKR